MDVKYSIIIPTVKATILVKQCVDSMLKHETNRDEFEIIIVDDGSDSYVQDWLKNYCSEINAKFIPKPKNQGFSHTVNTGMENASGKYLILVNNDILFIKPFLKEMKAAFDSDASIAIVGAKLLYPNHTIQHAGVVRIPQSKAFIHINKHRNRDVPEVNKSQYFIAVTGALFGIKRDFYEKSGGLKQDYFVACEDVEYCLRAWVEGFRVYYAHEVEAVHIEGETRGNTDATKLKKGPEWFLKEKETTAKFANDLKDMDLPGLDEMVLAANSGKEVTTANPSVKKLEVGCGPSPQPGYIHLDVRPLPGVDVVCDFSKDRLPFEDKEFDEILANHCIEHISWRKLPFVVGEWFRVLKPGGRVFLRTPDLEFIARSYLDGKITPEWPGDEQYLRENISPVVTPGWWANLKLFAGQDYDSNYHFLCFDYAMMKSFLERIGFNSVSRMNIKPVFSPGELQVEAYRPTAEFVSKKRPNRIFVKRRGALGDVLLTTPIVKKIKKDDPDCLITMATDSGAAYINNPDVHAIVPAGFSSAGFDKVYDLDLAYEKRPTMHIIDAFGAEAFGHSDFEKRVVLNPTETDRAKVEALIQAKGLDKSKLVICHMAVTWKNRTWSKESWASTVNKLIEAGYTVASVGSGGDFSVDDPRVVNLTKVLSIHQIAYLCSQAFCFVGNDSGLLHVAGSTEVPIVGLFTCAKGEYRIPYRPTLGERSTILKPTVDCYGCLAMEKPPVVFCDCRRSDYICLSQITPDMVLGAVNAYRN